MTLKITQAACEAAAAFNKERRTWHEIECAHDQAGRDTLELVEAFQRAMNQAADEALERAVKLIERRMEQRFAEHGTREWDTNACYYEGSASETYEALDEEDEEIATAIRALKGQQP